MCSSDLVFNLLHDARPVLLNLGEPGGFDITPWSDRIHLIDATYVGTWELPAIGPATRVWFNGRTQASQA